jgi:hypothetical protein
VIFAARPRTLSPDERQFAAVAAVRLAARYLLFRGRRRAGELAQPNLNHTAGGANCPGQLVVAVFEMQQDALAGSEEGTKALT